MNTSIFIEGQSVDLTEDISAVFTYAVDDVADIASRDTSFSKTVAMPGTSRNNRIFGSAFEFTGYLLHDVGQPNVGANFNAARSAKCLVLVHGIQVFKGAIRLMEIKMADGAIEYECAMFGELGGLMSAIGNRLLTGNTDTSGALSIADDLDFSAYNQQWSFVNITQSWADLATLGYLGYGVYYPLIDYGKCTTNRIDFSYQAMRPALYVHEYIVKIFEKTGYTYDCPFFETGFFKRLIIPHNEDVVYKMVRALLDQRSTAVSMFIQVTPGGGGTPASGMNFPTSITLNNFTASYSPTGASFTYTGPDALSILSTRLLLMYGGGEGRVIVTCELRVNGVAIDSQNFTMVGASSPAVFPPATYPIDITLAVPDYTLQTSDIVTVHVTATPLSPGPINPYRIDVLADSRITVDTVSAQSAPAVLGDDLDINNLIPKGILQRDFFMSIVKMFGLRVMEDAQLNKHVTIEPFSTFFDNSSPLDWSGKVDYSKGMSLKPMSEVNARYFNFLYERDTDFDNDTYFKRYGKGYADRTFDSGLDFAKEKKDVKIIFASSPFVGVAGLDKGAVRIMKMDSSGVEQRVGSKIRILQAKRIGVTSWDVLEDDLTTVVNNTVWWGYAGHVDDPSTPQGADLNFGAPAEIYWVPSNPYMPITLFAQFHSPYMAEITDKDSKLLSCFMRLSPVDILNLDFTKAILIDGQLWRLNRVIDYNSVDDDVTKVEVLKVIRLSY